MELEEFNHVRLYIMITKQITKRRKVYWHKDGRNIDQWNKERKAQR